MGELKQRVREVLERIKQEDKEINSFLWVNENAEREAEELERKQKKGRLFGKLIGVKANINVKGMPASCASQTLQRYIATYDASVVRKIKQEDGLIIGILNMDEFACGSSGETSAFGPTRNPVKREFVAGGSSSGSAAAVAAGFCDLALGSDTGGSVRNPASYCGVVGVKPSYGLVSRHGLIDLAMSLDQIGVCANSVADAALLLDVIRGQDPHDPTTFPSNEIKLNLKNLPKRLKVGWMSIDGLSPEVARAY
ncbi:Asp-tRNA(Asn)/Glu-tRNA(Gln) amidotransferase GatCAB subunit A, partial [Candidatus Pacearchaeota archaeon]